MPRIFISIASYRDPQLVPTVRDCLAKARHPDQLRFGVCWQHGDDEEPLPFRHDPRFRILDVDWRDSRGVGWARAEIMRLWDGEELYLQLDSHHRFAPGWDETICAEARAAASDRPLLTTYAPAFEPGATGPLSAVPTRMELDGCTDDGIPMFAPCCIEEEDRSTPLPSRFVSAHFCFAAGSFVADVPYDPDVYFLGEEISLSIRAFTSGYDLFHPSQVIVWHHYSRTGRRRHWDDHVGDSVAVPWFERDARSRQKVTAFLAAPHVGEFGCGTARTFADYEAYAGLTLGSPSVAAVPKLESGTPVERGGGR
jgi:hypothetical protein